MTEDVEVSKSDVARRFGMEILSSAPLIDLPAELYQKVGYRFVKKHLILPFREENGECISAVADPLNLQGIEELELLLRKPVRGVYCPDEILMGLIQETFRDSGGTASELLADLSEEKGHGEEGIEVYDLLDQKEGAPMIKLLNAILSEAIRQGASDIHFEPLENDLRVRYRIDGVLQTRHSPAHEYQAQLLARIKVMASLDIAEHRLPQDGRIKLRMGRREIDFRVSTVPIANGERIVLRILDKGNVVLGLDKLGMPDDLLAGLRKMTSLPEGIILVTGPTGSGKTTTLYSALSEISNDEINIMTVEDPIEYKLQGIAQIGVRPKIGLSFAAGLRHILRQDPDVVMIGEIRDRETAEIAIQSSLTGHLVLSTLHTNDAPSALTRLVDMGIEPYLLSSSVVGIVAQRLLRTICPHCKEGYAPAQQELSDLGLSTDTLYRGRGCGHCFGSGYKGRHGIYELMPMNHLIKQEVVKSADAVALKRAAIAGGMQTLAQRGARLAQEGITTVAEVLRVTRGIEEGE